MMTTFTLITGAVTVIGFILQIRNTFPKYRPYYSAATFVLLGLTIGILLASISGTTIHLPQTLSPKNIIGFVLFGGSSLLIFMFFVAAAFIDDKERRTQLSQIGSTVSGFLVFLLVFFTNTFFQSTSPVERVPEFTYDERIQCALTAVEHANYDRALTLLSDAEYTLPIGDIRLQNLTTLIDDIRTKQAAIPASASRSLVSPNEE